MPKRKLHTEDAPDGFDEAIAAQKAAQDQDVVQQVATSTEMTAEQPVTAHIANPSSTPREPDDGYAKAAPKKKWTPEENPRGWENQLGDDGIRVRLLKREPTRDIAGAWIIRFTKSPNTLPGYSKENPHPVLKMLKEEGFEWAFDKLDDKGGHGKLWTGDPYGQDFTDARRVMHKAAEMVGAKIEQGQGVSA